MAGPIGIFKTRSVLDGSELIRVEFGNPGTAGEIPVSFYVDEGYQPPIDRLPTKVEFEAIEIQTTNRRKSDV
jgi:hypothetical protein